MSDNTGNFFWGFLGCSISYWLGSMDGANEQKKINRDEKRDQEIEDLKRQINDLKSRKY